MKVLLVLLALLNLYQQFNLRVLFSLLVENRRGVIVQSGILGILNWIKYKTGHTACEGKQVYCFLRTTGTKNPVTNLEKQAEIVGESKRNSVVLIELSVRYFRIFCYWHTLP